MKDKRITTLAAVLLALVNVGCFAYVWRIYYNAYAFRAHRPEGFVGAVLVYFLLYRWLSKLYRGYAIASTGLGETLLSQFISFSMADLVLYVACCLLRRQYVNVLPGAVIVTWQLVLTALVLWAAKKILWHAIKPSATLLVYGGSEDAGRAGRFIDRLRERYGHLFVFPWVLHEDRTEEIEARMAEAEAVMFVSVDVGRRDALIGRCLALDKVYYFVPEFVDIITQGCAVKNFLDTPLFRYDYAQERRPSRVPKRLFDILLSLFLLVLLSPVMLLTALCVKLEDGGPVFFLQERVTLGGRLFKMLKFRSMVPDAERDGVAPATVGDPRVTRVGRVIRALRIDETPQLINVLLGQMSMVGPRPERREHVALYEAQLPEFRYRLRVKGGLTGYAQVYGKYNTSPEDKLRLDLLYVENQSLLLDFKLLLLTVKAMFQPERSEGFDEASSLAIGSASRKEDT